MNTPNRTPPGQDSVRELTRLDLADAEIRTAAVGPGEGVIDLHRAAAAAMFGVPYEAVTDEQRRHAKRARYLTAYGPPDVPKVTVHVSPSHPPDCDHDFPEAPGGGTAMDGCCAKCGISFIRYIHTECP